MLAYQATLSLALTYSLRNPALAADLLREAHAAAVEIGRPDLAYYIIDTLAAVER